MNLKDYTSDKKIAIALRLIFIIFTMYILTLLQADKLIKIFIFILWIVLSAIEFIYEYAKRIRYYNGAIEKLKRLDKKYLLPVLIEEPDFIEGKILYDILSTTDRSMNEEINKYIYSKEEYREYIEMWVHEIKTPISSSKLIIENNKDKNTLSILEEIEKIEGFIEQILYYSKSDVLEKDYIIKKTQLRKCVNNVIKRNKKLMIQNKIKIDIDDFQNEVSCDNKWLEFILNQIIINSIKYIGNEKLNNKLHTQQKKISIYVNENDNNTELFIKDNGIGIDSKDINRIFDKGFTGLNGRKFKKSTGMGLYISKKLSEKMYIGLDVNSKLGEQTTVKITFPKCNMLV